MTYGQLFMILNPNVKVVENGTCVWIFFDEVNHDTMRKRWWDKEIPDDANNAGWVSVKDRLPERAGKYLVVSKTALAELPPYVKTAWFLNNLRDNSQFKYEGESNEPGFYNGDGEGDWVERYVTHWMPLPEPPKEG